MVAVQEEVKTLSEMLADDPKNWGRWGPDDEIGCLNFQTPQEVLRGITHVRSGKVFPLGAPIGNPGGDPVWPGRSGAVRLMTQDKSFYVSGKLAPLTGGLEYADDFISAYLQGSTQYDSLGHTWYDDKLYNGFDAMTTAGGMAKCGVDKIAQKGVVGRGVLVDMARYRGKEALGAGETFGSDDLEGACRQQGVTIGQHDNLIIRTGWLNVFYSKGAQAFYGDKFIEPGLTYSHELVSWFHEKEIVSLSTDTIANEITIDPKNGIMLPLHAALMRNLGVLFSEICALEALAADCEADGQYTFLYAAAPINIIQGAGAPVNPLAVK
ncbi:MAG: cyclase family protein [Frankiaceae bacterium]